jgi:hypothetical protein
MKADLKEDATTEKLAEYATHGPDVHREGVVAGTYQQTDHQVGTIIHAYCTFKKGKRKHCFRKRKLKL